MKIINEYCSESNCECAPYLSNQIHLILYLDSVTKASDTLFKLNKQKNELR